MASGTYSLGEPKENDSSFGAFGVGARWAKGLIKESSVQPFFPTCRFEKMIGGLYLGELVRLVLVHLAQRGVLFGGCTSPALLSRGSILLEHVAEMEE